MSEALLDAANVGREVAMLTALCLMKTQGDPQAALEMLGAFAKLPSTQPLYENELDATTIAAQAIREAMGMVDV